MAQESTIYSLCFRSQDAVLTETGGYQFAIESTLTRLKPRRVVLGSIEMPLSQPTICKEWNRIYYCERVRLTEEARRMTMRVEYEIAANQQQQMQMRMQGQQQSSSREVKEHSVLLPDEWNPVASIVVVGRKVTIKTERDHGLTEDVVRRIGLWGEVETVACTRDLSITKAVKEGRWSLLTEREFSIDVAEGAPLPAPAPSGGGHLYSPSPSSPSAACSLLQASFDGSELRGLVRFEYDSVRNRTNVTLPRLPYRAINARVTLQGDGLLSRLGIPGQGVTGQTFTPGSHGASSLSAGVSASDSSARDLNVATGNFGDQLPGGGGAGSGPGGPPFTLKTNPFPFPYEKMREGWYAPSRRVVQTAQPRRISSEVDVCLNRFHLRVGQDGSPPTIVFSDPRGNLRSASILPGRYETGSKLAMAIQTAMSAAGPATFKVSFSPRPASGASSSSGSSAFAIECTDSGVAGAPTTFSLLFGHPESMEAGRLGFEDISYEGSSTYIGYPIRTFESTTNLYQLQDASQNGRIKIVPRSIPTTVGVAKAYDASKGHLLVETYSASSGSKFVSGMHGLVHIGSPEEEVEIEGAPVAPVSTAFAKGKVVREEWDPSKPSLLTLEVSPAFQWADARGRCLVLTTPLAPSSFSFSRTLPRTIGDRFGFEPRTYEWGADGITRIQGAFLPPYEAAYLPSLDHPDYILVHLEEGKRSSFMHHYTNNAASNPFAKLVLYEAAYREDRQLTRDLMLSSGESMNRFTIRFTNPDETLYCISGPFSFTLNFVV